LTTYIFKTNPYTFRIIGCWIWKYHYRRYFERN